MENIFSIKKSRHFSRIDTWNLARSMFLSIILSDKILLVFGFKYGDAKTGYEVFTIKIYLEG